MIPAAQLLALRALSPAQLGELATANLEPAEAAELLRLLEDVYGGEPMADFIRRVWPWHPVPRHLLPLTSVFERARAARVRVLVSMPPGHGKTVTLGRGIAWWLKTNPGDTCAYTTYNDTKAWSKSRLFRKFAREAGVVLAGEAKNVGEWRTAEGGGLLAAGAGGGFAGERVQGILVVDDPYKNREDADSEPYRSKIRDWFYETAYTRMEGASVLVQHHRWREDDLIGELAERGDFEYINLAALAEPGDPLGRAEGEALWPENPNFTVEALREIFAVLGPWRSAGLYQGRPQARGGGLFKAPSWYDPDQFRIEGSRVYIYCDPAASDKTKADNWAAYAIATRGAWATRQAWFLDELHGHWTIPVGTRQLRTFQQRWYGAPAHVEAVTAFKAVPQLLREADPGINVLEDHPVGDKYQRAQGAAAAWNQGRYLLPLNRPWTGPMVKELQEFPAGKHDDRVDAAAGAWNAAAIDDQAPKRGSVAQPDRWR